MTQTFSSPQVVCRPALALDYADIADRTPDEAIQAARSICCTMLTSGREENMVCLQNEPTSVRKLQ